MNRQRTCLCFGMDLVIMSISAEQAFLRIVYPKMLLYVYKIGLSFKITDRYLNVFYENAKMWAWLAGRLKYIIPPFLNTSEPFLHNMRQCTTTCIFLIVKAYLNTCN